MVIEICSTNYELSELCVFVKPRFILHLYVWFLDKYLISIDIRSMCVFTTDHLPGHQPEILDNVMMNTNPLRATE